ncbi:MAG: zinc-ribbon domain-containing protein [Rhodospirillales bacterium]|nr:zinc-ribbon domain-containing protein [Rhodospirillales bacterium]
MIITCPNCAARFNVADQALGAAGKTVRCAKCGHKWHQMPDGQTLDSPPPAAAPAPRPAPRPAAAKPAAAARPAAAKPAPRPVARPRPAPPMGDIPMEMAPSGAAPAASVPQPAEEDFPMPPGEAPSPNAFRSTGNMVTDSAPPTDKFLETAEPEPIPSGFASPPEPGGKKRSNALLYTLLVILALIVGIPAGLYFLRYKVVELLPMTAEYYQMLDLDTENLGAGLKFRNIVSERVIENNVELLVVRGQIANITDKPKEVPLLRLALYDSNNQMIQDKVGPPPEKQLASNETTGFRVQMENPSASARRFEITFAPKAQ